VRAVNRCAAQAIWTFLRQRNNTLAFVIA